MKISNETWTIEDLIKNKDLINPKPQYQRTSVWHPNKKRLLIDSILRGLDLPKFYLSETPKNTTFEYEATDGQQRMRTIWEFVSKVESEKYSIDASGIDGIKNKELSAKILRAEYPSHWADFLKFKLNFSILKNPTAEEKRLLFARLQLGTVLNPAELRHAIASNVGTFIFSITLNHKFFKECRISNNRYKHQDFLDHLFVLAYYDCKKNIKAKEMRAFYVEKKSATINELQPYISNINAILEYMRIINEYSPGMFRNKWAFVDTFYLIFKGLQKIKNVKPKNFVTNFKEFEAKRKKYNKSPEMLIDDKESLEYDKDMYDYIIAFKTGGAEKSNVLIRYRAFHNYFLNSKNFELK